MELRLALALVATACGGAREPETRPSVPVPLPALGVDAGEDAPPPVAEPAPAAGSSWTQDDAGAGMNVVLTIDFAQVRKLPTAAALVTILRGSQVWRTLSPDVFDWARVTGPSLIDTTDDDAIAGAAVTDAELDAALEKVARDAHGTPLKLHTPGAAAWKVTVDRAERVIVRPTTHVVAIVPPTRAETTARELAAHPPTRPPMHSDEVLRLRSAHPGAAFPDLPPDVSEGRAWVDGHADGTVDFAFEGDCPSASAASADAESVRDWLRNKNDFGVRLLTAGLLNDADVTTTGSVVRVRVHANRQQVHALLSILASATHVTLPP